MQLCSLDTINYYKRYTQIHEITKSEPFIEAFVCLK